MEINQSAISSWANESFGITRKASTGYCSMVDGECWYGPVRKEYLKGDGTKTVLTDDQYLDQHTATMQNQLKKRTYVVN